MQLGGKGADSIATDFDAYNLHGAAVSSRRSAADFENRIHHEALRGAWGFGRH